MNISDERWALHQLEHIGYYRLSGYWYPFRSFELTRESGREQLGYVKTDLFEPGTQFNDAVNLYHFDKQLRLILMDALESIEIALRVDIAYRLGARKPLAHLNPAALHPSFAARLSRSTGKTAFEAWQQKYSALLKRSKEDCYWPSSCTWLSTLHLTLRGISTLSSTSTASRCNTPAESSPSQTQVRRPSGGLGGPNTFLQANKNPRVSSMKSQEAGAVLGCMLSVSPRRRQHTHLSRYIFLDSTLFSPAPFSCLSTTPSQPASP
ncbi:Abi family protein [Pseudomonas putida]|uniref:Abi family protein n=1 Tax=Pseudomonas putida TaxID=303 RepID=UPI003CC7DE50